MSQGVSGYKIVRPDAMLRRSMTSIGFRFRQAYVHITDVTEYYMMSLPQGWTIERNPKVSVIFDEEGTPCFVELIGDIDHESRFVEVYEAEELHDKMMIYFLKFAMIEPDAPDPEGFALFVWMAENKSATLRSLLQEDNDHFDAQRARVWVQPPAPGLTDFTVRMVEAGSTRFARPARPSQQ